MVVLLPLLLSLVVALTVLAIGLRRDPAVSRRLERLAKTTPPLRRLNLFSLLKNTKRRQLATLERTLPGAIDLLSIMVTAGLNLNLALPRLASRLSGVLGEEIKKTCQQIDLGIPRRQALEDLAKRNKSSRLRSFVSAIIQAERYGTPLSETLKVQAKEARTARRQQAEELARKAPVKLLFPLVFLILPAFLLLTVGPIALTMLK